MTHFAYPNVQGAKHFIGCGRYIVRNDTPSESYELADPDSPHITEIRAIIENLVPETISSTLQIYEKRDDPNSHYRGESLDLAYLLACINTAKPLKIPKDISRERDIWCTGAIEIKEMRHPWLKMMDNQQFEVKLEAFLSPDNEDNLFVVPNANISNKKKELQNQGVHVVTVNEIGGVFAGDIVNKIILSVGPNDLPALINFLFEELDQQTQTNKTGIQKPFKYIAASAFVLFCFASALLYLQNRLSDEQNLMPAETNSSHTARIEAAMEKISQGFEVLAKHGGVIPNPKIPEEYYHNARVYELGGDYGNARRAYLEYFNFNLNFADPHLRFLAFLKVQEGREGAREVYGTIKKQSKSYVPDFALALLLDREKRIAALRSFASQHPEFGPALYELSKDYSKVRVGQQTLEEKKMEKEYLEKVLELDGQGQLVRYYLDKSLVAKIRQDIEERLAALSLTPDTVLKQPVSITWMKGNRGWMGHISIFEPVLEVFIKEPGENEFKSTGHMSYIHQQTGQKMPNNQISYKFTDREVTFEIKYLDAKNNERGPYKVTLNPESADLIDTKRILDITKTGWIFYREWDGKLLVYFSHLLSYRGALAEIHYGLNKESPDTGFKFPAFEGKGIAASDNNMANVISVPKNTTFITVQLKYKDGETTDVIRFNRQ